MVTTLVLVHFPDGGREFRYASRPPRAGDLVVHLEERYRIVTVEWSTYGDHVVTVTPETSALEPVSAATSVERPDRLARPAAPG